MEKPWRPEERTATPPEPQRRLFVGMAVGVVAMSTAAILIRMARGQGVPSLSIAAWRLLLASLVLLPYAVLTHRREIRSLTRREWVLLALSGVLLGLHFATWIGSLSMTSVASSVVLVSMGPVFVALGSFFLLRERPRAATLLGIIVAASGSALIGWADRGSGQDRLVGDLLALAGAVMMAGYLMIGRRVRARCSLVAYIALVYGFAMVTLLLIAWATGMPMAGFSPEAYGWLLALALVPQLIGHSTLNWALRHLSATFVAAATLAEPVSSSLLAYLLLGERIRPLILLGGALILAGIYVASRPERGAGTPVAAAQESPPAARNGG